jgi:hypothetical protein
VVNHWKPHRLGVASRQSPLMTWPPRRPGLILALRINQRTIHSFISLFLPPCSPHLILLTIGSLKLSLLVCSRRGGPPTWTFRTYSSPAPTPIKLQPAPAVLSQELVHTTLSITHHTRKRPSIGPRTTQALIVSSCPICLS